MTAPTDAFDVAPFGRGYYSSGHTVDDATWTKPSALTVAAFDLYWFRMPGLGAFQYRVDGGEWSNVPVTRDSAENRLHKLRVEAAVRASVEIRGHDGASPCVAAIVGIATETISGPNYRRGVTVHNLGLGNETLVAFCGSSVGNRLALLDDIRPDVVTVLFSNDVSFENPAQFGERLHLLVERVERYADVLLISPYEQRPRSDAFYADGVRIGRRDTGMQAQFRAITRRIADEKQCVLVDLYESWAILAGNGWQAATAFGLMCDDLHASQAGHDDIAMRVRSVLGC